MAFNQSGRRRRQNSFPEQIHDQSINNPTRGGQLLLLKDFLNDDYSSTISSSSSSSSDFTSIPRFLPSSSIQSPRDSSATLPLHRNLSRSWIAPAEAAISLIQKILAAVMKSPSGGRRMKRNQTREEEVEEEKEAVKPPRMEEKDERNVVCVVGGIRVKDILRWESFREEDLALAATDDRSEEEMDDVAMVGLSSVKSSPPLDMSPVRTPEIDTSFFELLSSVVNGDGAAVDVAATTSNSDESERLTSPRFGGGGNTTTWDSVDTIAGPTTATTTTECEPDDSEDQDQHDNDNNNNNDDHQHSPVSILDSPFRDNDDDGDTSTTSTSMSAFEETMASVERSKQRLLDSIKWFESLAAGVVDDSFSYDDEKEDEEENSTHEVVRVSTEEEEEELVKETSLSASQIGKESTSLHHLTLDKLKIKRYERLLLLNQFEKKGSESRVLHRCYNNVSRLNWTSFGSTHREECWRDMESATDDDDDVEQQQKQLLGYELEAVMFNDMLDHLVSDL